MATRQDFNEAIAPLATYRRSTAYEYVRSLGVAVERHATDLDMLLHAFRDRTDGMTDVSEMKGIVDDLTILAHEIHTTATKALNKKSQT